MKPLKLTMQAFGSYGPKTEIDFTKPTENLFLITGATGSGKTTIFDAIVFALYGKTGGSGGEGAQLQSDYIGRDVTPYAELTFTETVSGQNLTYTVRRVPRHFRPTRNGTTKAERETVSLILPDGTEYSQNMKATNEKLEQIIGLTKDQFMQIAMIAQGKFVEVLQADASKKKEIFRKLFHTELFQKMTEQLQQWVSQKKGSIDAVHILCQSAASNIQIAQDWPQKGEMESCIHRIQTAKELSITDAELLTDQLDQLCTYLQEQKTDLDSKAGHLKQKAMKARDTYTNGKALLKSFQQLEQARHDLDLCTSKAPEIEALRTLIPQIQTAYDLQGLHQRASEASEAAEKALREKQECDARLPKEQEQAEHAGDAEIQSKLLYQQALTLHSAVDGQVAQALRLLEQIQCQQQKLSEAMAEQEQAAKAALRARQSLDDFLCQKSEWEETAHELSGEENKYTVLNGQLDETERLAGEVQKVLNQESKISAQARAADAARDAYEEASKNSQQAEREFIELHTLFLDSQAGLLAKERLQPGLPCPVCGSIHHPAPCVLAPEHQNLTREAVEKLRQNAEQFKKIAEEKSKNSGVALEKLKTMKAQAEEMIHQLKKELGDGPDLPEPFTSSCAQALISQRYRKLMSEKSQVEANLRILNQINEKLQKASQQEAQLRDKLTTADTAAAQASAHVTGSQQSLETLHRQPLAFSSKTAALSAQKESKQKLDSAKNDYERIHSAAESARTAVTSTRAQIKQYEARIPELVASLTEKQQTYNLALSETSFTQAQWQALVDVHSKDTTLLQEKLSAYDQKKHLAQGSAETAMEAIGNQEKPDTEKLQKEKESLEQQYESAQKQASDIGSMYRVNVKVHKDLLSQMESRKELAKEYSRLLSLYHRLSGKVAGSSKMDLETYVQRYYLERILYCANKRFRDMSAGQFELRMMDAEQAGNQKNQGLDLMVYSYVTDSQREISTLSGGESFMAALSMALGMADQIQEGTASINLDIMFIDEGFGSLDDRARGQAVRVLQQMALGNKVIGIISHVTELKQEIESQLLVSRDENGSHIRWQIS